MRSDKTTTKTQTLKNKRSISLYPYRHKIPWLLFFQAVSKIALVILMAFFKTLAGLVLYSMDRPAFTSGDLPYMMSNWRTLLLMIIGLLVLAVYMAIDLNATFFLARRILKNEKINFRVLFLVIKDALFSLKKFVNGAGLLIILYISFVFPMILSAFGITVSSTFPLPQFIFDVIKSHLWMRIGYYVGMVALAIWGINRLFVFHLILFEAHKPKATFRESKKLLWGNAKYIVKEYLGFLLLTVLVVAAFVIGLLVIPQVILANLHLPRTAYRFWMLASCLGTAGAAGIASLLFVPFQVLKLTIIWNECSGSPMDLQPPAKEHFPLFRVLTTLGIIGCFVMAGVCTVNFDKFFPRTSRTAIIGHRGAGDEGVENTAEAIEKAGLLGLYGAEIDVQRTMDGEYILCHDKTFERVAGDYRSPMEMTMEEIRELDIKDMSGVEPLYEKVPTLDEVLDVAAKSKVHLYIELKGPSADFQMVDDVYHKLEERDMVNQCALISLKYGLISYAENFYPEAETGYLLCFGFGQLDRLSTDIVGLESQCATDRAIADIHRAGKKVIVWSCDTTGSLLQFLLSDADGIITNSIGIAQTTLDLIANRGDLTRVLNFAIPML